MIDRCIANSSSFNGYISVVVEIFGRGMSGHCPLSLNVDMEGGIRKSPFKSFNDIVDHDEFRGILVQHWGTVYPKILF